MSGFAEDKFTLDVSGFQNDKGAVGAFSLSQTGNDLYLNFTPVFAFPAAYGRAWGTFQRLPISGLLATCTTGNVERAFVSVATGSQGTTPTVSGGLILIAPTHNLPETFPYVVQLAGYPSSLATNTITLLVTNAVSRVNGVVANGSSATISFAGVPGYQYLVQRASSVSGPWTDLDGSGGTPDSRQTAPSNGTWTFTDSSPPNPSFYRGRQNND